jgi:predicted RNA polymerase sigma factor
LPEVAAGIPSRRENLSDRRADLAGKSRPLALEPGADRRGSGIGGESPESHRFGAYTLQAAIAAVHAQAESAAATDWRRIVALYNHLVRIQPSPVVRLNRAAEARASCEKALALTQQEPERQFLQAGIRQLK